MDATTHSPNPGAGFELCFRSLYNTGRGLSFPCDATGKVDMDALPDQARNNYFYARALMGRDFAWPVLQATGLY